MTTTLDTRALGPASIDQHAPNIVAWAPIESMADGAGHADAWSCDNCAAENQRIRKRCADCGTTRD